MYLFFPGMNHAEEFRTNWRHYNIKLEIDLRKPLWKLAIDEHELTVFSWKKLDWIFFFLYFIVMFFGLCFLYIVSSYFDSGGEDSSGELHNIHSK